MQDSGEKRLEPFVSMLAHLHEPLLLVSHTGVIVTGNVAAAEALGTTTPALAGTTLAQHAAEPGDLDARIVDRTSADATMTLRTRDGRRFTCHPTALERDVLLVRLSGGLHPATLDELSRTMLPFGMSAFGAEMGGMYLLDEDGLTLELVGSLRYRDEGLDRFRLVSMAAPIPLTASVRTAKPLFLLTRDDFERYEPGFLERYPFVDQAMTILPLIVDERCIGAIFLGARWPWQLDDGRRSLLQAFAAQCAVVLEQTRRSEAADVRRDVELAAARFERLHGFTKALAQAVTPEQVIEVAIEAGMIATGAMSGAVWLVDDGGSTVTLVRNAGPKTGPQGAQHARVPLDRPARLPILDVIQTGAPVWLESCRQFEVHYPEAFAAFRTSGDTALGCVPLLAQGRCIGGLSFFFSHAHRFVEHERTFFQMIAWYAAQALERSRLYAAEQHARSAAEARQRRSAFLAESDTLLATLDYEVVVGAIASIAVPRIADWCIVEIAEERRRGKPVNAKHVDPAKTPFVVELSARFRALDDGNHGIPTVIRTGRSLLYHSITADQIRSIRDRKLAELYMQTGVVSSMVVPITARGRTLGAILLNSADPARLYDEDDLAMAEELGRKVGLAIENARLYREVREADQLKDEFLAMLSHELRNPLVPIVAATDLMALHDSQDFAQERGLIQRNAEHLVRLVDDLLDVSRITRGKISLTQARCDIADLVRDALDIAYPLIEQGNHRLLVAAPLRGVVVFADRVRIGQAIANLLTNAAKYTEPGGTITVSAQAEGPNAIIRVEDTGIGIAADVIPRIFDLFVQAPDPQLARKGGLGIGLTIVKRLVEAHGGTVTASSEGLGLGSTFLITLPLTTVEQSSHATPSTARAVGERRVLVVDDNKDAAVAIGALMKAIGFTANVSHDGFAALAIAPTFEPDLALLDLGLPRMDGYELARRLRALHPTLRIVAVTGFGQPSDRERSQAAGFDEHIIKPVTLDTLRQLVERLGPPPLKS